MEKRPIYSSIEPHRYLLRIEKYLASKSICEADAEIIKRYISYKLAADSISTIRTVHITGVLLIWRKNYLDCNFSDITDDIWLTSAGLIRQDNLKQNTIRDYMVIPREFLNWLHEEGINRNLTPAGIQKVKLTKVQRITKTSDQLLSDDDVIAMLHSPQCKPVTAALISVLYYTGMRPSEALSLRWKDLEFSNRLLKIRITDTKTGKFRYAPCTEALEYVAYWRNHYPDEISGGPEGDNFVFVSTVHNDKSRYRSMSYKSASNQIKVIGASALDRNINLYLFRGSDITNSAVKGVPDSVNKAIHWGNQSTGMLSTYLLLKDNQIDQAILKRAGIEEKTEEEVSSKPILCNKCFTMNQAGSEYCRTCGEPLTRASIEKQRQIRQESESQQNEKDMGNMLRDVAEVFGMTLEEFTAKMMKIKKL